MLQNKSNLPAGKAGLSFEMKAKLFELIMV